MTHPTIQRHSDAFDDRNLFLALSLGVASYAGKLDAAVEVARRQKAAPGSLPAPDGDSEVLYFALGLVAFSRRAVGFLDAARRPQATSEPGEQMRGESGLSLRGMIE